MQQKKIKKHGFRELTELVLEKKIECETIKKHLVQRYLFLAGRTQDIESFIKSSRM